MTRAASDDSDGDRTPHGEARVVEARVWRQADTPARATTTILTPNTTCQAWGWPAWTAETFQNPVITSTA